jgi:hypothetical protein
MISVLVSAISSSFGLFPNVWKSSAEIVREGQPGGSILSPESSIQVERRSNSFPRALNLLNHLLSSEITTREFSGWLTICLTENLRDFAKCS